MTLTEPMQTRQGARDAVLAAAERLLRERPLHELSVADLIEAAAISRSSFYAHFGSKTAVIAECLSQVLDQITLAFAPLHARAGGDDLEIAIRGSVQRWVAVCERHGALLRAVSEQWPHDERLRELWSGMLATVAAGTARVVRDARAAGRAPSGADPLALAACLTWGFERVLHVSLAGGAAGLPQPAAIAEPLAQMMLGGLFGAAPDWP
ncbi:MAG: TetR/AcrR family transcriptional regulator [Solirubrobacteraceae bacterium]